MISRAAIVAEAESWIGTPYHHQQSVKGVGCDCLGLVRGVWRALLGPEPEDLPAYSRDWGIGAETLLDGARRHLVELPVAAAAAGDVLIFRYRSTGAAKHCGILVDGTAAMIHAWDAAPSVVRTGMAGWWWRRAAAAFAFPGAV